MWFKSHDLSSAARKRVTEAVTAAEKNTAGEIVVVMARMSSDHVHVPLHIATGVALAVPLITPFVDSFSDFEEVSIFAIFFVQLAVFIAVALLFSIPTLRYLVTPKRLLRKHSHQLAAAQYLASNIVATQGRTGVLIFVSLFERYVEVIGDQAISSKLKPGDWDKIVKEMLPLLRDKRTPDALVLAVERCGALLAKHFPPGDKNPNELSDQFIVLE